MNRFAVSPIPPLSTKGTAQGGIVFSNSWNIEVPYDGFYGMKGTVDNGGRILVDGKVILQGGYFTGARFAGPRTLKVSDLKRLKLLSSLLLRVITLLQLRLKMQHKLNRRKLRRQYLILLTGRLSRQFL